MQIKEGIIIGVMINTNKILSDFDLYVDEFGLTQDKTDGSRGITSGNGILYTAEHMVCLRLLLGEIPERHARRARKAVLSCEKRYGLLWRAPDKDDQTGPDDYYGAIVLDHYLNTGFSERFLDYGRNHHWHYVNDLNRGKYWSGFFFFHGPMYAIARLVAENERVPAWLFWWWRMSLCMNQRDVESPDNNAYCLTWVHSMMAAEYGGKWFDAVTEWKMAYFDKGITPGEMFGRYFQNDDHPLARWLR